MRKAVNVFTPCPPSASSAARWAAATFGDVPTGHAQFQFVEALVASGITVGCGGGKYCPDAAVTRRQMAKFLAKALGLNWPEVPH